MPAQRSFARHLGMIIVQGILDHPVQIRDILEIPFHDVAIMPPPFENALRAVDAEEYERRLADNREPAELLDNRPARHPEDANLHVNSPKLRSNVAAGVHADRRYAPGIHHLNKRAKGVSHIV